MNLNGSAIYINTTARGKTLFASIVDGRCVVKLNEPSWMNKYSCPKGLNAEAIAKLAQRGITEVDLILPPGKQSLRAKISDLTDEFRSHYAIERDEVQWFLPIQFWQPIDWYAFDYTTETTLD